MSSEPFWAHLCEALRAHRAKLGPSRVPTSVLRLEEIATVAASGGLERTSAPQVDTDGDDEPMLLDTATTAHRLSLSERTVRRLIADERLHAVAIGRARRVRTADLERFVAGLDRDGEGEDHGQ